MSEPREPRHPILDVKVIQLRPRKVARRTPVLHQEDFEKCIALRAAVRQKIKELEAQENFIATALRSGAAIEPGTWKPELVRRERRAYNVRSGFYFQLKFKR